MGKTARESLGNVTWKGIERCWWVHVEVVIDWTMKDVLRGIDPTAISRKYHHQ